MSDDSVRLSKRMTELGLCSRREADEYIEQGLVRVDGVVVNVLGSRVLPQQQITLDAAAHQQQAERVTILLNKPAGFVSGPAQRPGEQPAWFLIKEDSRSSEDRSGLVFLKRHQQRLAAGCWLDADAHGLLVLSQDGRILRKLKANEYEQEFLVWVHGRLDETVLAQLKKGLSDEGELLGALRVSRQSEQQLCFILKDQKRRHIQRMCAAVGLRVEAVQRIRIGRVRLGKLAAGQWRYLPEGERF